MKETRPNEKPLALGRSQETRAGRGRLKVFFGVGRAVGKTTAMLAAARQEQAAGREVVIGCVEANGHGGISPRTEGLPAIPALPAASRNHSSAGIDLPALLARRPQLVVVDELARANGPFARHPKRYQDVLELLDEGIDVFTTLNIDNVESCAEAVRQITGETARETVPDTVLEAADFVLVDVPVSELLGRLGASDVYAREAALAAQRRIFRPGSLSALRELTLRFVAEHVGRDVLALRHAAGCEESWKSGQRLLVGVTASSASGALVRWARRAAGEMHAAWVAVHVEAGRAPTHDEQRRLTRNLTLARELGAEVVCTSESDAARGLLRVAREQNVTQIVVGKPSGWRALDLLRGGSLFNRLVRESGDIDVHAVRVEGAARARRRVGRPRLGAALARDCALAAGVVVATTGLNGLLARWTGYQPLALVYLLGVVVAAMFVGPGPALGAAVASALALDYFFEPPALSLRISNPADIALFCTYAIVALIVGNLTARLRRRELAERRRERHATGLYLLTGSLAQASHACDLPAIIVEEVGKAHNADVAVSVVEGAPEGAPQPCSAGTWRLSEAERNLALWAFRHRQPAGRGTGTEPQAEGLHLPLVAGDRALGVLSLRFDESVHLTPDQRDLLDAFARQIGLALDRQRLRDAEQHAELAAESERLSKTLLNSISHEMRTPLAAITSAASTLSDAPEGTSIKRQRELADEIQEAARRLNRLVGNVLNMTRVETGHVKPKLDWCDITDLAQVTLDEIKGELARHRVAVELPPSLPLVRADFVLMQQVLTNLLLNAAVHTPPGTVVRLSATTDARELVLSVADNGPGLPAEALPQLFDKFYRGPAAAAGGTGLGLAIVKGFVEAHDGRVRAENRPEGGCVFTVCIPLARPRAASLATSMPATPVYQ